MRRHLFLPLLLSFPFALGCATLHRTTIDEIDARQGRLVPFDIRADEVGVNVEQAGRVASAISRSRAPSRAAQIATLFEFGPKTGNPTTNDDYADRLAAAILARCPGGRVTGVVSMRVSETGYVLSSEEVHVKGFCIVD
jgi:hypothetical protein